MTTKFDNRAATTRGVFGDKLFNALNDAPIRASIMVGIGTVCNDCGKPLTREEIYTRPYTGLCVAHTNARKEAK
jgi:hypothetical protein